MAFNFKKTAGAAPAKRKSRYAGFQAAQPRDPIAPIGKYRFRFAGAEETVNPKSGEWFRLSFEVVESENPDVLPGTGTVVLWPLSPQSMTATGPRVKAFAMALVGAEDEAAYDAFDPEGAFIDALVGASNDKSDDAAGVVGRLVDVTVTRGRDTKDGNDYFREYAWEAVEQ